MNGIFNYQVPGRSTTRPMSRQPQQSFLDTPSLNQPSSISPFEEPVKNGVRSLLQQRLQQIDHPDHPDHSNLPRQDVSTFELGEEDGGGTFFYQIKPMDLSTMVLIERDRGLNGLNPSTAQPLELTTKALGEEDVGLLPSKRPPSGAQPLELTTKALGEEDGFYR